MIARALMLQGTGSDVGKSILVAGLCRVFARKGMNVLPFKPQNMSNNAAVAADGGEIGRAQWLQARAAGVEPSVHMNPVLLKPESDTGSQVIVHGKPVGTLAAKGFREERKSLLTPVLNSFDKLRGEADLVLVEGAGSPAEVNLRAGDIANMGFALAANVPVALIGDIDRGGVIASIVGTHALLTEEERKLISGTIINKFRGEVRLFDGGLMAIEDATGWPNFGVVPYVRAVRALPAEDAVVLDESERSELNRFRIIVPMLSRIANFDDLDPLRADPQIEVRFVPPGTPLPQDADLIVLPGTKATLADLRFLKAQGWDIDTLAHHRAGKPVLGICGGYQMLGQIVRDPDGVEGVVGEEAGLALLEVETILTPSKTVFNRTGHRVGNPDQTVEGYEIHSGVTDGVGGNRPFLEINGESTGAVSADGRVFGTYLHGLFGADYFRHEFLRGLGAGTLKQFAYEERFEQALEALADALEATLDIDALWEVAGHGRG